MTQEQLQLLLDYIDCSVRRHVTHILAVVAYADSARDLEVKCNAEWAQTRRKLYAALDVKETVT